MLENFSVKISIKHKTSHRNHEISYYNSCIKSVHQRNVVGIRFICCFFECNFNQRDWRCSSISHALQSITTISRFAVISDFVTPCSRPKFSSPSVCCVNGFLKLNSLIKFKHCVNSLPLLRTIKQSLRYLGRCFRHFPECRSICHLHRYFLSEILPPHRKGLMQLATKIATTYYCIYF